MTRVHSVYDVARGAGQSVAGAVLNSLHIREPISTKLCVVFTSL